MNKILFVCLSLILTSPAFAQNQGDANPESQGMMNLKSLKDFQAIDKQLNVVFSKLLSMLDDQGKAKLLLSERAWLAYRDAEANFQADTIARGGTMAALIYNESRVAATQARIEELNKSIQFVGK